MNLKRNCKILPAIQYILIFSSLVYASSFRSYGNEHLELTDGPGGSVFGQLWGLYHNGSDNVRFNPLELTTVLDHNLFLFHSILYNQLLTASSGAFSFPVFSDKKAGLMVSRISVDQIPDTRSALLDWGLDGIPGTGDEGEGNGILDPGEHLNYDDVTYHNSGITTLSLGTELREIYGFRTGLTVNGMYMNLIEDNGFGLSFDLHAYRAGKVFKSIYAIRQLPFAATAFTNGSVQMYSPYLDASWVYTMSLGSFSFLPGLTVRYLPGYERNEGINLGRSGNILFRPAVLADYDSILRVGTSYDERNALSVFTQLMLKPLTLEYAYRMHSHSLLGNSHMVSVSFNPDFLLED